MRTAPALALLTVGAILAYAVNVSVPVVDLNLVGTILALVGLLWLAVEIGLEVAAGRRDRPPRRRPSAPSSADAGPPAPYDPVIRPSRRGDDGPGRAGPPADADDPTRVIPRHRR